MAVVHAERTFECPEYKVLLSIDWLYDVLECGFCCW